MGVVDVVDERVQRADPLGEAPLDRRPFGGGEHPRHEIERPRPVTTLAVGPSDLERDPLLHEDRVAPAPGGIEGLRSEALERGHQRGGVRVRRAVRAEHLVAATGRNPVSAHELEGGHPAGIQVGPTPCHIRHGQCGSAAWDRSRLSTLVTDAGTDHRSGWHARPRRHQGGGRRRPRCRRPRPSGARHHRSRRRDRRDRAPPLPTCVINCAAYTDVDGAEQRARARARRQRRRRRQRRARGRGRRGVDPPRLDRLRVRRRASAPRTSSPTRPHRGRSTAARSLPGSEAVAAAAPRRAHDRPQLVAVRRRTDRCFPATILRLAGERDQLTVVDDQVGCPTFTGHLAVGAASRSPSAARSGSSTSRPRANARWYEFAQEIVDRSGQSCATCVPGTTAELGAPRPASRLQRARQRTRRRATAARRLGARGSTRIMDLVVVSMRLLVCGGAGFIGSTFVHLASARPRRRGHGARQAHLRRPQGEPARRDR